MRAITCCKLACGLLAAVAAVGWCASAEAQPIVHFHPRPVVIRPAIVRPYPVVTRVVVPPTVVYRQPVVYATLPANPAPAPICVTILNPAESGATLSFQIDGTRYVLSPGAERELHFSGPRTLEFDRGGGFGTARVLLREGAYRFVGTDRGWLLRREA